MGEQIAISSFGKRKGQRRNIFHTEHCTASSAKTDGSVAQTHRENVCQGFEGRGDRDRNGEKHKKTQRGTDVDGGDRERARARENEKKEGFCSW